LPRTEVVVLKNTKVNKPITVRNGEGLDLCHPDDMRYCSDQLWRECGKGEKVPVF